MKTNQLLKTIQTKVENWDERSQFKIAGVGNLSISDLETIKLYVEEYIQSGGTSFGSLMDPMGEVKEVLDHYGIVSKYPSW